MTTYAQKPPQLDAVLWDGTDIAAVQTMFPEATAEGDICSIPVTMPMPGTMPVPANSYITRDPNGNTSYVPKDYFELNYEEVA